MAGVKITCAPLHCAQHMLLCCALRLAPPFAPSRTLSRAAVLCVWIQVEHLSARQADRADRLPQRGDDLDDPIGGHVLRLARDVVEGLREQRVAGEDGDIVAVQLVVRRLAAPEVVVVHRRQ
eukprot:4595279-Prymnesium_polylepis.2